jgi:hypothetical protein
MVEKSIDMSISEGGKHLLIQGDFNLLRQVLLAFSFDENQELFRANFTSNVVCMSKERRRDTKSLIEKDEAQEGKDGTG